MCGIAGLASAGSRSLDASRVDDVLAHRGPDGSGAESRSGEGWAWDLLHRRLSIVDLSDAGLQPIANEDRSLWLTFNGEIYNYPELRELCLARGHRLSSRMDGEAIVHLWEDEGPAALARLNGIFALSVADARSGEVWIARDPLGVKPLFYVRQGADLWFGSEIAALREAGAPIGGYDTTALAQFLSFLWIPDPRTPYENVRSLRPGEVLSWRNGETSIERYRSPFVPSSPADAVDEAELVRDFERVFTAAVERQLMADVPIGLMASGGIDSSLIWWASKAGIQKAFSIEWGDSGSEKLAEDAAAVRDLQEAFGTEVAFLPGEMAEATPLPPSGDLFADPAYELTRLIAREARDAGFKVLLSGQGGDELFAGYRRHLLAPWIERFRMHALAGVTHAGLRRAPSSNVNVEYAARLALALSESDPLRGYMHLCSYSTGVDRAQALGCYEEEVSDEVVWQEHRRFYEALPPDLSFLRKMMAVDLSVYMPGLGLAYVDRAGMEFGVEIRVPWLDLELVEWSLRVPDDSLIKGRTLKNVPKTLAARVLSHRLAHRPKRGFASPTNRVQKQQASGGQRGFRQGTYFARAKTILEGFLQEPATSERPLI
ncbi:MAG TPA: asparagine synthase (glutamine-hydrolyzing) [Actinomycetota bacterium]|jgi:asparagine synthase (glutamine-hydrolysing)